MGRYSTNGGDSMSKKPSKETLKKAAQTLASNQSSQRAKSKAGRTLEQGKK